MSSPSGNSARSRWRGHRPNHAQRASEGKHRRAQALARRNRHPRQTRKPTFCGQSSPPTARRSPVAICESPESDCARLRQINLIAVRSLSSGKQDGSRAGCRARASASAKRLTRRSAFVIHIRSLGSGLLQLFDSAPSPAGPAALELSDGLAHALPIGVLQVGELSRTLSILKIA
jgi:hypothetical protein